MLEKPFKPIAFRSESLQGKPPSLWVVTYAYKDGEPYVLLRDPVLSRGDKDNMSFVHFTANGLRENELETREDGKKVVLFDKAARRILAFFTGFVFPENQPLRGKLLYHEKTTLFSGPKENQEVIACSLCLGRFDGDLPPIKTFEEGGLYPDFLDDNEGARRVSNGFRNHHRWVPLKEVMENIKQFKELNKSVCAPSASPFKIGNLSLTRGRPEADMAVQQSALFILEQLARRLKIEYPKPKGRSAWVPKSHIRHHSKELQ